MCIQSQYSREISEQVKDIERKARVRVCGGEGGGGMGGREPKRHQKAKQ